MNNLEFKIYNLKLLFMHADYFSPIKSRIRVFSDKIEFFNAGSYPKPIEYFLHSDTSMPRNPILAKLFRVVKLACIYRSYRTVMPELYRTLLQ
jgi:hypothetical protein